MHDYHIGCTYGNICIAAVPHCVLLHRVHVHEYSRCCRPAGQQLVLVGGCPQLGDWDPQHGARLFNTGGHAHRVEVQMPVDVAVAAKVCGAGGSGAGCGGRGTCYGWRSCVWYRAS